MSRFVHAIIVNPVGEVLLQQRSLDVADYPGSWSLFGGEVKTSEGVDQAMLNRLFETLAFRPHMVTNAWIFYSYQDPDHQHHHSIYIIHTTALKEDLVLTEGRDMDYFRLDELLQIDLAFNIADILKRYLKIA